MTLTDGHGRRTEDSAEYQRDKLLKDIIKALVALLVIAGTVIGANYAVNDTRYVIKVDADKCHGEMKADITKIDKTSAVAMEGMTTEMRSFKENINARLDRIEGRLK